MKSGGKICENIQQERVALCSACALQLGLGTQPVECVCVCVCVCVCSLHSEHRMCFLFVALETKQPVHGDIWVHLREWVVKRVHAQNPPSLVLST